MQLLITNETRHGAEVQLTQDSWVLLEPILGQVRNGPKTAEAIRPYVPTHNRPFRVRLDRRQLEALAAAAATI